MMAEVSLFELPKFVRCQSLENGKIIEVYKIGNRVGQTGVLWAATTATWGLADASARLPPSFFLHLFKHRRR